MSPETFLIKPGQTWVALGDSITEDPNGYVSKCAQLLADKTPDLKVVNAGVGGNKARDMVSRFDRDVLSHAPNVVTISVGVNDVWHGFFDFERGVELDSFDSRFGEPLEDYRSDLQKLASLLTERDIVTVFVSPTMIGEDPETRENKLLTDYIEAMKDIAKTFGTVYCPMNEFLWHYLAVIRRANPTMTLTTDGVHMRPYSASLMAGAMLMSLLHGSNFPSALDQVFNDPNFPKE